MAVAENGRCGRSSEDEVPSADSLSSMHRISAVRRQQGISLRSAARQLGTDVSQVRVQENENSDLRLSDLYQWQRVLDVPVSELLVDPDASLSAPILERAQLLRLMKTALAILQRTQANGTRHLAEMLVEQLVELAPELKEVSPWHAVGQRRSLEEFGRVAERVMSEHDMERYHYE